MSAARRPAKTLRTALLAAGSLLLCGACADPVDAGSAEKPQVHDAAPETGVREVAPEAAPQLAPLTEPVRAIVQRWTAKAAQLTRGAASARNVRVSVHAALPDDRWVLAALEENRAMRPASNMKLLTTAAALVLLGPGIDFVTPFEALGSLEDGVLRGDLVVHASGDPLFDPSGEGRVEGRLAEAARGLRAAGLSELRGDLVLDEGSFQEPAPGPAWPDPSQHWAEYCALSAGFTLNGGVLCALVEAGRAGSPARVRVHPSPHGLAQRYAVTTVSSRELEILVGATRSAVTVRGKISASHAPYLAEFAHPDPVLLFGTVLRAALSDAGIRVHGETLRRRGCAVGTRLYELRSPLEELLEPINAESRNGVADQLFLALGQALGSGGTRTGGGEAIALALQSLGVPLEGLVAVDGSGLSRDNRVSARQIAALIAAVLRHGEDGTARLFRDSLAVMGESGTLEGRLRGTHAQGRVFAKTGWIRGTSALSGIVDTGCPGSAVFSILVEYPPELGGLNNSCFKKMQDEIVLLIASHVEDLR